MFSSLSNVEKGTKLDMKANFAYTYWIILYSCCPPDEYTSQLIQRLHTTKKSKKYLLKRKKENGRNSLIRYYETENSNLAIQKNVYIYICIYNNNKI